MKRQTKLTSGHQEQVTSNQQQTSQQTGREFGSVEELLRHDALHTPVPPTVAHRLQESIAQLPTPSRSWWRRLFGQ